MNEIESLTASIREAMARPVPQEVLDRIAQFDAEPDNLAHIRARKELEKNGVKVIHQGASGYPDLLIEIDGKVFGIEIKGKGDRLKPKQIKVIEALNRLESVIVIRESGTLRNGEVSLEQFLRDGPT